MLHRLFPRNLTNAYEGSWVAVWLFAPILIIKTLMGFNFTGLNPFIDVREILENVDGVPISTFTPDAAEAVVHSSGAWGLALLTLCVFAWVILIRYRAALPLAILLISIEQVGRTGAGALRSISELIATSAAPTAGAIINIAMSTFLTAAFVLSLLPARRKQP
jgi:hypothetical protein